MRIHPREQIVFSAEISLSAHIIDWMSEESTKELTDAELLSVLTYKLGQEVRHNLRNRIRFERHGNYDDPGGLE